MARRRRQQRGYLYRRHGSWILEWREYRVDGQGNSIAVRKCAAIARCEGPSAIKSEQQVRREIVDPLMRELDRRVLLPETLMTVRDFWNERFGRYHLWKLKPAGRRHYEYLWRKLDPVIGDRRLADITPDDVERVLAHFHQQGLSAQTVTHLRNAISAIFRCAKRLGLHHRENPASLVEPPPIEARRRPTLTAEQARLVIAALPSPAREMATLSMACSLNVAELCGLRQKWVNLTEYPISVEGEALAPLSLAVRENYSNGQYGTLKTGRRRRIVPLTPELAGMLRSIIERDVDKSPDAPVFQSRTARPVDGHNIASRIFRPLGKRLGFPITWRSFRRAHSTLAGMLDGIPIEDRVALMGHADARMTLYYSIPDIERRRAIPAKILSQIVPHGESEKAS